MNIQFEQFDREAIEGLLGVMSPQFDPPLSDGMDLEAYASKLYSHARFLVCRNSGGIIGCIAHYPNRETSVVYIPLVWVDEENRGEGVAKEMFRIFFDKYSADDYRYSDLEVLKGNSHALRLYTLSGYGIIEDRGEKYLMRKKL